MSTRKCDKCGWTVKAGSHSRTCPVCHTEYGVGRCDTCGEVKPLNAQQHTCADCQVAYFRKYRADRTVGIDEEYSSWLNVLKKVKQPYSFLTQDQWEEACRYFDGCAMCDSKEIDARGFFVPFKDGGRYCDWNVLPLCDKCATKLIVQFNPFRRYHPYLQGGSTYNPAGYPVLLKAVAYLRERLLKYV